MVSQVALLAEGVDRNTLMERLSEESDPSPSSRRAWIEIGALSKVPGTATVALLAEGVDRNTCPLWKYTDKPRVALLAEGVDRNNTIC